jgi:ATP-dependent Clp protease adaptor protein ClpS
MEPCAYVTKVVGVFVRFSLRRFTLLIMKLWFTNDDVNTFDHVIETLIKVCEHTPEQN